MVLSIRGGIKSDIQKIGGKFPIVPIDVNMLLKVKMPEFDLGVGGRGWGLVSRGIQKNKNV